MQHSIRLFEKNHLFNLTTQIINCSEQQVKVVIDGKPIMINAIGLTLAETIFHPQGGGQPADKGNINDLPLLTVKEDKTQLNEQGLPTIFHVFDSAIVDINQFKVGQEVHIQVDESYRKQCMRSHTAGHLIADALELNPTFYPYKAKAIQGNHFPGSEYIKVILDVQPDNLDIFCEELNQALNELIFQTLPISITTNNNEPRHISIGK